MVEVTADPKQELLKISFSGHVSIEDANQSEPQVRAAVLTMPPGFRLLTDLSRLDSMDPACAAPIRRNMDACNHRGVSKVVRIIPDPSKDIGLSILSMFHYRPGIPIATCNTLQEAMAALA